MMHMLYYVSAIILLLYGKLYKIVKLFVCIEMISIVCIIGFMTATGWYIF